MAVESSNLNELLGRLELYPLIIVTGPQFSGTNIGAQVIAAELGHRFIEEPAGGITPQEAMQFILCEPPPLVLHAPSLFYWVHRLKEYLPYLVAVVMFRKLHDIYESQLRWDWQGSTDFFKIVRHYLSMPEFEPYLTGGAENPARMGYMVWAEHQQNLLGDRAFVFWYDWLKEHEAWVPLEERQIHLGWGPRETIPVSKVRGGVSRWTKSRWGQDATTMGSTNLSSGKCPT